MKRPLISVRADFDFSETLSHMCSPFGSIMWLHLAHVVFKSLRKNTQSSSLSLPALTTARVEGLGEVWRAKGFVVVLFWFVFFFFLFVCFPSQISRKCFHPKTKGIQTFLMCCRIKLREKNIQTQPIHFI